MMNKELLPEMKWIPGFENRYQISPYGEIYSCMFNPPKKIEVKRRISGFKVITLALSSGGGLRNFYVHRLVLELFVEKRGATYFGRHKNGDKMDNSLENLEWVAKSELKIKGRKKMPVMYDGKYYESITDASVDLKTSRWMLKRAINKAGTFRKKSISYVESPADVK